MMFVTIGRLINLYFVIHKNAKKTLYIINIGLHFIIFKLNMHKIKLNLHSKMATLTFNYKLQNCKCTIIKYLEHYVCSGIELRFNYLKPYVLLLTNLLLSYSPTAYAAPIP